MNDQHHKPDESAAGWRLKSGLAIFVLSILLPFTAVPAVVALDLSSNTTAIITGVLLITAEVMGVAAVAVMGKPGYILVRGRLYALFRRYGPRRKVSRRRYRVGLVMFCIPLLFALVSAYAYQYLPGYLTNPLPYAIAGDLILITSLFVLGGEFWDKLKALFSYDAKISD